MTETEKTIPDALKAQLWAILGDFAAETAMQIQATKGAPRRFVEAAHKILEMHRELRPEQYGPPRNDEPDFYGEIIEPPKIMCGCCKATGIAHEWTKEGDLRPTKTREPCKECNGSGWAKSQ